MAFCLAVFVVKMAIFQKIKRKYLIGDLKTFFALNLGTTFFVDIFTKLLSEFFDQIMILI